jgi:hypothetical protein
MAWLLRAHPIGSRRRVLGYATSHARLATAGSTVWPEIAAMNLSRTWRSLDKLLQVMAPGDLLNPATPMRFDSQLPGRLLAIHEAVNARFAPVAGNLSTDPEFAIASIRHCQQQLSDLRRAESAWLYPFIASGVDDDLQARRQLMQLRIGLQAELRATLRHLDDLGEAIANGALLANQVKLASASIAGYLQRSETEIYPLYTLIGTRRDAPHAA